jgi:hypothetical protein
MGSFSNSSVGCEHKILFYQKIHVSLFIFHSLRHCILNGQIFKTDRFSARLILFFFSFIWVVGCFGRIVALPHPLPHPGWDGVRAGHANVGVGGTYSSFEFLFQPPAATLLPMGVPVSGQSIDKVTHCVIEGVVLSLEMFTRGHCGVARSTHERL